MVLHSYPYQFVFKLHFQYGRRRPFWILASHKFRRHFREGHGGYIFSKYFKELKSSVKPYYALGGHGTPRLHPTKMYVYKSYSMYLHTMRSGDDPVLTEYRSPTDVIVVTPGQMIPQADLPRPRVRHGLLTANDTGQGWRHGGHATGAWEGRNDVMITICHQNAVRITGPLWGNPSVMDSSYKKQ